MSPAPVRMKTCDQTVCVIGGAFLLDVFKASRPQVWDLPGLTQVLWWVVKKKKWLWIVLRCFLSHSSGCRRLLLPPLLHCIHIFTLFPQITSIFFNKTTLITGCSSALLEAPPAPSWKVSEVLAGLLWCAHLADSSLYLLKIKFVVFFPDFRVRLDLEV